MSARTKAIEKWTWVLIYGGLFFAALGWFVRDMPGPLSEGLLVAGSLAVVAGVVMIVVRSRMKDGEDA